MLARSSRIRSSLPKDVQQQEQQQQQYCKQEKPKYGGHQFIPRSFRIFLVIFGLLICSSGLLAVLSSTKKHRRQRTGPPAGYVLKGKRQVYTKVPETSRHAFHVEGTFRRIVTRAFRSLGWKKALEAKDAQIIFSKTAKYEYFKDGIEPWQRYNHFPGMIYWDAKEKFSKQFKIWREKNPTKTFYLPETYELAEEEERAAFEKVLRQGGTDRPWVLKDPMTANGKGITMLGPNSDELHSLSQTMHTITDAVGSNRIVQTYICNELTWRQNQKFDLRFYWMVASVDPLIILYHDGYVRVGNSVYNEIDWSSTTQHLTTHTYLADEVKGTVQEFEDWLDDFHHDNMASLYPRIRDPVHHVRNQLKEIVAQTADCFKDLAFDTPYNDSFNNGENGYALYGFDTILDRDLDVWYIEAQGGPGMEEEFDFRVEMHRELLRPMIGIVDEIQTKQEKDPSANLLPLESLGGWEIVYAGDWMYEYEGYERTPAIQKQPCKAGNTKKENKNRD